MNPQIPIENTYWVVPGKFLAGEYPRNRAHASSLPKLKALLGAGVTSFVHLSELAEPLKRFHLSRYVVR